MKEVAERAGVSKSTVSRILNNRKGNGFSVKEELRQRVLKTAKELNYRPNLMARSLTMQSMVSFIVMNLEKILSGIVSFWLFIEWPLLMWWRQSNFRPNTLTLMDCKTAA